MTKNQIVLFVSSLGADRFECRKVAIKALQESGPDFKLDGFESWPAKASTPQKACLDGVRDCDIYVGVYGREYSGPVQEEYEEARRNEIPRFIFIEDCKKEKEQQNFLNSIKGWEDGNFIHNFKSGGDLKYEIRRSLEDILTVFLPRYLKNCINLNKEISLRPLAEKTISIENLIPIRLVEGKSEKSEKEGHNKRCLLTLEDAVRTHSKLIIVGQSGAGKTVAARKLLYNLSTQYLEEMPSIIPQGKKISSGQVLENSNSIPVYLPLLDYRGSLLDEIAEALERGDFLSPNNRFLVNWLKRHNVVLLFDGLDQLANKKRLSEDLEDLCRKAPKIRFVVTSQPIPALKLFQDSGASRLHIDPPTDDEICQIFSMYLGTERAEELINTLKHKAILEPFRLPLFASFGAKFEAKIHSTGPADTVWPAKGALYQAVFEDLFHTWDADREPSLVARAADTKLFCLAGLAEFMLRSDIRTIDKKSAVSLCQEIMPHTGTSSKSAADIIDELLTKGVLAESQGGVSFWHPSFRDYFAAESLEKEGSSIKLLLSTLKPRYYETVIFLAGILEEKRARYLLQGLIRFAKFPVKLSMHGPGSWASGRIFLLLLCLTNTRQPYDDLKDKALNILPREGIFLEEVKLSLPVTYFSSREDVQSSFYYLIGQLQTSKAFKYLHGITRLRRYRLFGLAQFQTKDGILIMLEEILKPKKNNDSTSMIIAATLFNRFPGKIVASVVQDYFFASNHSMKMRVLELISNIGRHGHETYQHSLREDKNLIEFLSNLALNDPDRKIRYRAATTLTCFGDNNFCIPLSAEKKFLEALKSGNTLQRYDAVWYLERSVLDQSKAAIIRAVEDNEEVVGLHALYALRTRDNLGFPDHLQIFLIKQGERFDVNQLKLCEKIRADLENSAVFEDKNELEKVLNIIFHMLFSSDHFVRKFCARALGIVGYQIFESYLALALEQDPEPDVRNEVLIFLTKICEERAEGYLLKALEDTSSTVRMHAINMFYSMPESVRANAATRIHDLKENDPDEQVRQDARIFLL